MWSFTVCDLLRGIARPSSRSPSTSVHRSHQAIIIPPRPGGGPPPSVVALTFEPHPISVLRPELAPGDSSTPPRNIEALASAGADCVVVAASTPELFAIEAAAFIRDVLVARFQPQAIVEGRNFRFGHNRAGDIATLRDHESACGYRTVVVEPVQQELADGTTERISSSLVRRLVSAGEMTSVTAALGRPYILTGTVVPGAARGRDLGFPTANIRTPAVLLPGDGVYAGFVDTDNRAVPAAISIGHTPTFAGDARQFEAHLLDFSGDLYARSVAVHVTHWIRAQQRFGSPEKLIAQIQSDIARVRELTK
ncbi:MAG: bifunctional riboflavin kinase/FMN adenylyltransferase [Phycisphaerales bacterium]|nr:bifunctional riboflavin kinase/FMN adenylyltransferase [Phycisphaerales bacterium]